MVTYNQIIEASNKEEIIKRSREPLTTLEIEFLEKNARIDHFGSFIPDNSLLEQLLNRESIEFSTRTWRLFVEYRALLEFSSKHGLNPVRMQIVKSGRNNYLQLVLEKIDAIDLHQARFLDSFEISDVDDLIRCIDLFITPANELVNFHEKGYLHRDITLPNMLALIDKNGKPSAITLIDFGLAYIGQKTLINALGTLSYQPPEIIEYFQRYREMRERGIGLPASKSSDTYSFMVSFWRFIVKDRVTFGVPNTDSVLLSSIDLSCFGFDHDLIYDFLLELGLEERDVIRIQEINERVFHKDPEIRLLTPIKSLNMISEILSEYISHR